MRVEIDKAKQSKRDLNNQLEEARAALAEKELQLQKLTNQHQKEMENLNNQIESTRREYNEST